MELDLHPFSSNRITLFFTGRICNYTSRILSFPGNIVSTLSVVRHHILQKSPLDRAGGANLLFILRYVDSYHSNVHSGAGLTLDIIMDVI